MPAKTGGVKNWQKGRPPTAAVFLIFPLLCTEKWAKWGVKWGVKMLKPDFWFWLEMH